MAQPMDQPDRDYLMTLLPGIADELLPKGLAHALKWENLKACLDKRSKYKSGWLETCQDDILKLYLPCLTGNPCSASDSRSASTLPSRPANNPKVEDGFIRISPKEYFGARFSKTWKSEDNWVGLDLLEDNNISHKVLKDRIELSFWMGEADEAKKSYRRTFRVKKDAKFDVQLGKNWEQEESSAVARRPPPGRHPAACPPPIISDVLILEVGRKNAQATLIPHGSMPSDDFIQKSLPHASLTATVLEYQWKQLKSLPQIDTQPHSSALRAGQVGAWREQASNGKVETEEDSAATDAGGSTWSKNMDEDGTSEVTGPDSSGSELPSKAFTEDDPYGNPWNENPW